MKIVDLRARTVLLPIEAPLRHSYSTHRAFARTVLELFADEGLVGLGEVAATVTPEQLEALRPMLIGEDPLNLERIGMKISQRRYTTRQGPLLAAVEMACLDLVGKRLGEPVGKLLGGTVRDRVEVAAYLFYRDPAEPGGPAVVTPEEMVAHARDLVGRFGFRTLKLKAGVFPPEHDLAVLRALRAAFPEARLRVDPNATWAPQTALRIGRHLADLDLEYFEDPSWGLAGLASVTGRVGIPTATNMCVTEFDHLGPAVRMRAVDIVLSDPWYWGGLRATKTLAVAAAAFGLGVGMHSGLELGIGLAAMLHVASTMPQLVHAIDAHYHHLLDDVVAGPMLRYEGGSMAPPAGPGLGVALDEEKMARYAAAWQDRRTEQPLYPHDPARPDWYPLIPAW